MVITTNINVRHKLKEAVKLGNVNEDQDSESSLKCSDIETKRFDANYEVNAEHYLRIS